ncbi:hypothetical protein C7402_102423 [Paraburkholderia unamae]|uniref:Uncharacterized protein n=1 Tax=Paraburkholderia unamae TaxID=219649 RepID=A0ABX5KXR8_9BURK|nr:hypothetical protein C7402_102423 [Paraburkholderia unamae]
MNGRSVYRGVSLARRPLLATRANSRETMHH